jgi:hypothetical protein
MNQPSRITYQFISSPDCGPRREHPRGESGDRYNPLRGILRLRSEQARRVAGQSPFSPLTGRAALSSSAPNKANLCRFSAVNGLSGAKQSQLARFLTSSAHDPIPNRKYSITEPEGLGAVSSFVQNEPNCARRQFCGKSFLEMELGAWRSVFGVWKRTQSKPISGPDLARSRG